MERENINVKNVKDLKYAITEKTNIIARSVVVREYAAMIIIK